MTDDPFRPRHHLTAPKGWLNDPNGLIKLGDDWHVFYQHDPDSILHGPMHWGHACTRDFLNWHHLPIALAPQNGWTCFSGCALQMPDGALKLVYTDHQTLPDGQDLQQQSLVHANLALGHFVRDPANPVLPSPAPGPFRDPKVFWHSQTERWIMVITIGQAIGFYASADLRAWEHLSDFGAGQGYHCAAPWECPDLILLQTPQGDAAWLLVVSTGDAKDARGTFVQYFIGTFDGRHFSNANAADTVLRFDHGPDFYAPQSFFRTDGGAPVVLGWASNWSYARQTPTQSFRGALSCPRQLSLVETTKGLRLVQTLPEALRQALPPPTGQNATYRWPFTLGPGEGLFLFNAALPQLSRSADGTGVTLSRHEPWVSAAAPGFLPDQCFAVPQTPLSGELYVDRGIVEISLLGGTIWLTQLYFPDDLTAAPRIGPA
jgi:fructan beta-fructosidase